MTDSNRSDPHPDSPPGGVETHPDQPDQNGTTTEPGRTNVEGPPPGSDPGDPGGTLGTGGTNRDQDQ